MVQRLVSAGCGDGLYFVTPLEFNPLSAELINQNFQLLEAVSRDRDPQLTKSRRDTQLGRYNNQFTLLE